jgi:hypothetical protein
MYEIYLKNKLEQKKKKVGAMIQVVECLFSKCETLSSNPQHCQEKYTFVITLD